MAFPVVESVTNGADNTADSNWVIGLPSGIESGDLLVVCICNNGGDWQGTLPEGWSYVGGITSSPYNCSLRAFKKTATGSEGSTVSIPNNQSTDCSYVSYRISGASGSTYIQTFENTVSEDPDPPSLSPSPGADDYLWIAGAGHESARITSGAPTNYSSLQTAATTGSPARRISTAHRALNAATEDPGAFNTDVAVTSYYAYTIAVQPESGLDLVKIRNEQVGI